MSMLAVPAIDGGFDILVRVVNVGDYYGKNEELLHTGAGPHGDEPLVEFIDTRCTPKQVVSRYTRGAIKLDTGASLGGRHQPEFSLSASSMVRVIAWLREKAAERPEVAREAAP